MTGCHEPKTTQPIQQDQPVATGKSTFHTLGLSVEGVPIGIQVMGDGADTVLLMATIHGDEPAGTPLLAKVSEHLAANPQLLAGRRVILMPIANPDGYRNETRHNVNGVDLNRNFPAGNFKASDNHGDNALSEPESRIIHKLLEDWKPARIVSIHQPLSCIDYDGPADDLARAMAQHTDLPVKKLGSRPGSLGSYAGLSLGIPIITLELPEEATNWTDDQLWQRYGQSLIAAIRFPDSTT